ncbi:MAG: hypothetical protein WB615_09200 [Candidatus Tumulicola sp.]
MLVFDCESTTDETQRLTFGSYRFFEGRCCLEEGIFHAEDLPERDRATLEAYVKSHVPATKRHQGNPELLLLTRREFLERFYIATYKARSLIVGFNLPFDLSRLACNVGAARGRYGGGFSLALWEYEDLNGARQLNKHRPRIAIKHIDSKRSLIGFTGTINADPVDLIPEGSKTGESEDVYKFRGHFLDLRTLAFVLTDRGHNLDSACKAFDVQGKIAVDQHGIVSAEYIEYNRQDVAATTELAYKLLDEYDRFDVNLQETKAISPASLGKAHLLKMGIPPILERQGFDERYLGYAQSAFVGGRTSAHIRKVPVPVVYTDFLSMYPTVNALMGLWNYVIAKEVSVVPVAASEIDDFLRTVTRERLFDPNIWTQLPAFARVIPNGDILPTRAKYSLESNDYQVGLNHLYASSTNPNDGLWFALPDLVASVILTGRIPQIVKAFRIEAKRQLSSLRPITLRGSVPVDPRSDDFFRKVIEERKRLENNVALPEQDRVRLDRGLKTLANGTSYGIFAEMIREQSTDRVPVTLFGIDPTPFLQTMRNPERPGAYCFPPLASLITAGARLMLALLERCVTDLGGTYAMEDTDSMAIVATRRGGLIECPGGPYRKNGNEAIRALPWAQVNEIALRFTALNPYDQSAVPSSILKIEPVNFDPKTGKQRQVWCLAISAKRYALFLRDRRGEPALLRAGQNSKEDQCSEHGLGHLLNPSDPESDDRSWIAQAWLNMVRRSLHLPTKPLPFEKRVAVGRMTVSSPAVMKPLQALNTCKPYGEQIKPFNFILGCHVAKLGHPVGADTARFHLIAPYELDPRKWKAMEWIDQYSGKRFGIAASGPHGSRSVARVKSYGDVLREYEHHPEAKCTDSSGAPCSKQSRGLLSRRHVLIDGLDYIGKESNRFEEVAEQSADPATAYTEYVDPRRDEWATKILPKIKAMPLREACTGTGSSRAQMQRYRNKSAKPHAERLRIIERFLKHHRRPDLGRG